MRSKADNRFRMIFSLWSGYYAGSIWRNGEIQYRTVFLKLPASSTPPFRVRVFSFLIPPHLFLPSTALPSGCRIVFRLNLKIPPSFHLSLSGQGAGEKWRENNHCGENTKSSCTSSQKSVNVVLADIQFRHSAEFSTLKKITIVRFWRMSKIACCSPSRFYNTDQPATNS